MDGGGGGETASVFATSHDGDVVVDASMEEETEELAEFAWIQLL